MNIRFLERTILNRLEDEKFTDLKELIKTDVIYINDDRDYIAIDVNSDKYREDKNGQTFIFTAEADEDSYEYDEDEDMSFNQYIAWEGNEGHVYGQDLESCLEHVQKIALNISNQYK